MEYKSLILAAACLAACGTSSAEDRRGDLDMPLLHRIQDTVCAGSSEIVFIPVSHDMAALRTSYAVISMRDPDPDAVDIVSEREKLWLAAHGCNGPKQAPVYASGEAPSDGFKF